jgi:hypothetical protein
VIAHLHRLLAASCRFTCPDSASAPQIWAKDEEPVAQSRRRRPRTAGDHPDRERERQRRGRPAPGGRPGSRAAGVRVLTILGLSSLLRLASSARARAGIPHHGERGSGPVPCDRGRRARRDRGRGHDRPHGARRRSLGLWRRVRHGRSGSHRRHEPARDWRHPRPAQRGCLGDPAAVARARRLLRETATLQNQHVMGFGAGNPEPPGRFDWSSLDARVALMRATGATPVITPLLRSRLDEGRPARPDRLAAARGGARGGFTSRTTPDWRRRSRNGIPTLSASRSGTR